MGPCVPAALLILADGRLPTGGHAHSGGLEEAVGRGAVSDRPTLERWLLGRLRTAGRVEATFAAVAAGEALGRRPPGAGRWSALHAEMAARIPSVATRRASLAQGRGLLRVAATSWPAPWIPAMRAAGSGGTFWPVALGGVAAAAGLPAADAALLAASAAVQGPAWAATRLMGLDPFEVAAAIAMLGPDIDAVAHDGAQVAERVGWAELPGPAAPLTDIGAERHSTWEVRLFAS